MIYEDLRALLIADAPLAGMIGDRVRFLDAPAGQALPDIVQYPASGTMDDALDGAAPPWTRRISFECRGSTYSQAHAVGEHVVRVLNNLVGTVGTEQIQACRLVSDVPLIEETSAVRRRVLDFRVTHAPA